MNTKLYPTIVIPAFNRTDALKLLLKTVALADYPKGKAINLIISIDKSNNKDVQSIAEEFNWHNGKKEIIVHKENLGLKKHIIFCGDLTDKYESIILFEDDLLVTQSFYFYALSSLEFYKNDPSISGISLYNPSINEVAHLPFLSLNDGNDNYMMQVPSSLGQIWTRNQWNGFKDYFNNRSEVVLPNRVRNWPDRTSWKKLYYEYNIAKDKYYVYPKISFIAHIGKGGTHYQHVNNLFISEIIIKKEKFTFSSLENSKSIYDGYNEIKPDILKSFNNVLENYDFACDFNGAKNSEDINCEFIISSKKCSNSYASFGFELIPPELNVVYNIQGSFFNLGKKSDFTELIGDSRYMLEKMYIKEDFLYAVKTKYVKQGTGLTKKTWEYKFGAIFLLPKKIFVKVFRKLIKLLK